MIDIDCFSLVQSFLFVNERNVQKEKISKRSVEKNDIHHHIRLFNYNFLLFRIFELNVIFNVKLMKLSLQHSFLQQLLNAYEICLKKKSVDFERKKIK